MNRSLIRREAPPSPRSWRPERRNRSVETNTRGTFFGEDGPDRHFGSAPERFSRRGNGGNQLVSDHELEVRPIPTVSRKPSTSRNAPVGKLAARPDAARNGASFSTRPAEFGFARAKCNRFLGQITATEQDVE